eukprot:TRINITY_DN1406_c0_g1_i1.p1 TRINITY_DN1406_c0_g1~~TRINITY_DN1406_c0_g1_i1.p1  ORF type:complete len:109 (+),score=11.13 TRINITY_DN1406_c0_g1_i1:169-495(+)
MTSTPNMATKIFRSKLNHLASPNVTDAVQMLRKEREKDVTFLGRSHLINELNIAMRDGRAVLVCRWMANSWMIHPVFHLTIFAITFFTRFCLLSGHWHILFVPTQPEA